MKIRLFTLTALLCTALFTTAQVLTEQFEYTPGSTLASNGWDAHSASGTNSMTVGASSLTFPTYSPTPVGGSAICAGSGEDVNKYFGPITSGSIYASFLFRLDTIGGSGYFFHFMDSASTSAYRARTYFQADANNPNAFNFGLTFNSSTGVFDTTEFMLGDTLLVVAKYTIVSGVDNDEVSLYVFDANGSFATEPSSPLLGPVTGTNNDIDPARIALRQFNTSTDFVVDAFSVSTTWNMSPTFTLAQIDLPITWDDTANVDYTVTDFGGSSSLLAADPTNSSNIVLMSLKDSASTVQPWAGTTLSTASGLANEIPFTGSATTISAVIYSPDANITVRLKAEDKSSMGATYVEAEAMTTVANAWDTLVFNFANNVSAPALDTNQTYDLLSIFYNFNVSSPTPKTYYLDDVFFGGTASGPTLAQIDLPITWDDTANVNYTVADFGGNVSMLTNDPVNSSNKVLRSTKTSGSQTWAGTTLSTATGLANEIPFTSSATTISCAIYSPNAGVPVYLKAEDAANQTVFVETGVLTTVANAWDTLVFDFANPINGSLDTANTYNKLSIFYNFGTVGTGEVYYLDDVFFGGIATGGPRSVTFQLDMSNYAGSFTTPEVNGTFNSYCGNCNIMFDPDGNNIWETTVTILADSIEYLFSHDFFAGIESFAPGAACTKTTISPPDTFVNRFLVITGDTTLPAVCWESCGPCSGPPANSNVTFRVDLSQYTGSYSQVNLNGTFNNWCGSCAVMTDANNDSIYEITVTVPNDTIQYLFTLDGFTVAESLTSGDPCTISTISPPDTFVNRYFVPVKDTTLPIVCWESCAACSGIGLAENGWTTEITLAPNPTNGLFILSGGLVASSIIDIEVVDLNGNIIHKQQTKGYRLNETIDLSAASSGMYMVRITTRFGTETLKLVKTR